MTKGGGEDGGRAGGGPGYVTEPREGSLINMDNLTVISWGVYLEAGWSAKGNEPHS